MCVCVCVCIIESKSEKLLFLIYFSSSFKQNQDYYWVKLAFLFYNYVRRRESKI